MSSNLNGPYTSTPKQTRERRISTGTQLSLIIHETSFDGSVEELVQQLSDNKSNSQQKEEECKTKENLKSVKTSKSKGQFQKSDSESKSQENSIIDHITIPRRK